MTGRQQFDMCSGSTRYDYVVVNRKNVNTSLVENLSSLWTKSAHGKSVRSEPNFNLNLQSPSKGIKSVNTYFNTFKIPSVSSNFSRNLAEHALHKSKENYMFHHLGKYSLTKNVYYSHNLSQNDCCYSTRSWTRPSRSARFVLHVHIAYTVCCRTRTNTARHQSFARGIFCLFDSSRSSPKSNEE